jgi:hypothetical protein
MKSIDYELKVTLEHNPAIRGTDIYLYGRNINGSHFRIKPVQLEIEQFKEWERPEPTFIFSDQFGTQFLQNFVNALVEIGFKPDEIKAHDKQVIALKEHLEDMRKLVFKHEGIL